MIVSAPKLPIESTLQIIPLLGIERQRIAVRDDLLRHLAATLPEQLPVMTKARILAEQLRQPHTTGQYGTYLDAVKQLSRGKKAPGFLAVFRALRDGLS